MDSLEDTSSHRTSSSRSGIAKITGVIGVIVVALGFIFFGTRAEPVAMYPGAATGGLAVFGQTGRWIDPASFARRRNAATRRYRHVEQRKFQHYPDM